jgi:hypothetical protein
MSHGLMSHDTAKPLIALHKSGFDPLIKNQQAEPSPLIWVWAWFGLLAARLCPSPPARLRAAGAGDPSESHPPLPPEGGACAHRFENRALKLRKRGEKRLAQRGARGKPLAALWGRGMAGACHV